MEAGSLDADVGALVVHRTDVVDELTENVITKLFRLPQGFVITGNTTSSCKDRRRSPVKIPEMRSG